MQKIVFILCIFLFNIQSAFAASNTLTDTQIHAVLSIITNYILGIPFYTT